MIPQLLMIILLLVLLAGPYMYRAGPWSTYSSGGLGIVQLLLLIVLIVVILQLLHVF